jgi:hypothetical protein
MSKLTFTVSKEDNAKVTRWLHNTVYPAVVRAQQAALAASGRPANSVQLDCWREGYPYSGASGGGLTFEFTPTSIGTVSIARYAGYEGKLDFTDYDSW